MGTARPSGAPLTSRGIKDVSNLNKSLKGAVQCKSHLQQAASRQTKPLGPTATKRSSNGDASTAKKNKIKDTKTQHVKRQVEDVEGPQSKRFKVIYADPIEMALLTHCK